MIERAATQSTLVQRSGPKGSFRRSPGESGRANLAHDRWRAEAHGPL